MTLLVLYFGSLRSIFSKAEDTHGHEDSWFFRPLNVTVVLWVLYMAQGFRSWNWGNGAEFLVLFAITTISTVITGHRVSSVAPRQGMLLRTGAYAVLTALGVGLAWLPIALWALGTITSYWIALFLWLGTEVWVLQFGARKVGEVIQRVDAASTS